MPQQGLTNYAEEGILDYLFGAQPFPAPPILHFGLHVGPTVPNYETGAGLVEPPTAAGYARSPIDNTAGNFPAAVQNVNDAAEKHNGGDIPFPQATDNWGNITHWFIADGPTTADNVLAIGILDVAKDVLANDTASFANGNIVITLN